MQVAVDIGGTFTDVILLDPHGGICKAKTLSTPPDFERGVVAGLRTVLKARGAEPEQVSTVLHGMTVATNAVLEGRGAATALVTTKGFRDVVEMGRGRRPSMYDLKYEKPQPLARRRHRFEVDQRITATGEVERAVTPSGIEDLADRLRCADIQSVAVALINSFLRPDEERRLTDELRRLLPELFFTASVDVAPEMGEYERSSTAVVNAYLVPVVDTYLSALQRELSELAVRAPFYVMQSNGGLSTASDVRRRPVCALESGPAAGVMATRALAREAGIPSAIAFDMGGTTAKATLVEHGEAAETSEYEVCAGMNARRGLNMGAGHTVLIPTLDIAEIGAGGGSVYWVDAGGAPRVGPHSAGASPGPACYGAGGELPTLSDAAVVLGYINASSIAGGAQPLRADLAEAAVSTVAQRLGLSVLDAAYGAVRIAVANMTRLLRAVTVERGRDPRDSVLVAFGGAGPAYAAMLARDLQVRQVVIPLAPGLFSAVGLLAAERQHDDVRPYVRDSIELDVLNDLFGEMEAHMVDRLTADGYTASQIALARVADMHYRGQRGILKIAVPDGTLGPDDIDVLRDRLDEEHAKTYGHRRARQAAQVVNLRLRATCAREGSTPLPALAAAERELSRQSGGERENRSVYFGPDLGRVDTPVVSRLDLEGGACQGPVIVEEMDSTTVVPPFATVEIDALANLVLTAELEGQ